jgi:hypothetical protein
MQKVGCNWIIAVSEQFGEKSGKSRKSSANLLILSFQRKTSVNSSSENVGKKLNSFAIPLNFLFSKKKTSPQANEESKNGSLFKRRKCKFPPR